MPLTQATLTTNITFAESSTNTGGWNPTVFGADSLNFNLQSLNIGTYNQLFAEQYTILTSASHTIDLTSQTNFVNETIDFLTVLTIIVLPTGSSCTLQPGASNGLQWFFGGLTDSITIPSGGVFLFSGPASGPGAAISGMAKTLELSNPGGTTLTVDIAILGST